MTGRRAGPRTLLLVCAAIIAMGVGALFHVTGPLEGVELSTVDARFDFRGQNDPPADVVIVGIDDKTLEPGVTLPLDRRRHARVIRRLAQAGAGVIAYDVQFTEQSGDIDADNALILAVRSAAPRVILGSTEVNSSGETQIFGGDDGLAFSKATPAATAYRLDTDGVIRRMPADIEGLENFALAAVRLHTGRPVTTRPPGSAWIDYPGPSGTVRTVSFVDVEQGNFDASLVRDKIVVVGATSPRTEDIHQTSVDRTMSGAELEAGAIATALTGFQLQQAPWWTDLLIALALGALAPLVAIRFGGGVGAAAGVLATVGFLVAAVIAFGAGTILAVVPPLAAALTGVVGTLIVAQSIRHPWVGRLLDRVSRAQGMNPRTRRLRAGLLLVVAASAALLGLVLEATHALQRVEYGTINARFDVRGERPPPQDIVLVAIDNATFQTEPKPTWPFSRHMHAAVIRNLDAAGAKVIAYDVQFTESSGNRAADKDLRQAVRSVADRIVLATTEVEADGSTQVLGGGEQLRALGATPAFSAFVASSDGRIRRYVYEHNGLEGFDTATVRLATGRPVPEPGENRRWLDFAGPPFTVDEISFRDVASGRFPAEEVRGKIVVVGATASVLQDRHPTPTSEDILMPGPEIHVNGIQTALDGFPLQTVPGWLDVLLVLLVAVAAPVAALRFRIGATIGIGVGAVAALLIGAQIAFNEGAIVTIVYPIVGAILAIVATGAIHAITLAFERAQTRDAFARFVPESVVDQVLEDAEGVRLGGVRGEATVMFSDLRGFTSFAETLEPEQVIAALNRYLTAMSEAILDHGGTLVAYMGDGIMAVFGAPLKQDDHADRALAAARDMLDRLHGFNESLREEGLHEGFKMGIGLNSGPVMSGNVGSERRLEYTALGDTTNTAARLEGMTKGTPHQLFLADSTREALLRPADDLIEVGEFEVRGRKAKIKLWSVREGEPQPPPTVREAGADSSPASQNGTDVGSTADVPRA